MLSEEDVRKLTKQERIKEIGQAHQDWQDLLMKTLSISGEITGDHLPLFDKKRKLYKYQKMVTKVIYEIDLGCTPEQAEDLVIKTYGKI